ncbi:MAG: hypothetical protein LBC07_02845 [Elusimicrobiota bacterium]|jgi:hypothetical protein|nr:hypothetical protein [Elusimicrobiota bacterium]
MRKIWLYLALPLLFISQAVYSAQRSLLDDLVKDVTAVHDSYYMEYYLLSSQAGGSAASQLPALSSAPYVDWAIEHPYNLEGWHGIVPYNLYRSKILALSKFKLKRNEMQGRIEKLGLQGYSFEVYTFKKYGPNVVNRVLYTIEIVPGDGISITKYYDNTPITKQFFEYNADFERSLRAIIPPNQLQDENGWEANSK